MRIWNTIIQCNFFSETVTVRSACNRVILFGMFLWFLCDDDNNNNNNIIIIIIIIAQALHLAFVLLIQHVNNYNYHHYHRPHLREHVLPRHKIVYMLCLT
jgi:hypothetical protein